MRKFFILYETKEFKFQEANIIASSPENALDKLKAKLKANGEAFVGSYPPVEVK